MKVRGKRLASKHKADLAQKPVTGSISPQAKSCSILPTLIPEEVQLPEEIDSLTSAQAIRECSKALKELNKRSRRGREVLLTAVYARGLRLMMNKVEYDEFVSDPFWKDRQGEGPKPDGQHEAVRFAIIRALAATTEPLNQLATRDGNAFQQLANEGVQPEDLWEAFKKRGGRDTLSKEYVASKCPESRKNSGKPVQKSLAKSMHKPARQRHDFDWDTPGHCIELSAVLLGVRDGLILWKPTGVKVIHSPRPDVPADAVLLQTVKLIEGPTK